MLKRRSGGWKRTVRLIMPSGCRGEPSPGADTAPVWDASRASRVTDATTGCNAVDYGTRSDS